MSTNARGTSRALPLFFLGLTAGLACTALTLAADKPPDAKAEADAAKKEDDDEMDRRSKGGLQSQRMFHGTFLLPSDSSKQTNADVIGTLVTDEGDMKPNQTYLVKVEKNLKEVIEVLKRNDTKKVTVHGKVRNQGKYLIAISVIEAAPGAPVKEQRHGL
ncbi:MAG: hypothetical protein ABSE73_02860 [Planctomycetota bacterium]